MKSTLTRVLLIAASVAVLAAALAACGGGDSSSSSESTQSTEANSDTSSGEGGQREQAAEFVAPYIGQPSPFPVTEKLNEVPKGSNIVFVDCGTPYCADTFQALQPAADAMGVTLDRINAGHTAATATAAFDSVVAKEPDAVISMAVPISLWSRQLEDLQQAGAAVMVEGVSGKEAEEYEVQTGPEGSTRANVHLAELMANYVVAKMTPNANIVYYAIPEVAFTVEAAKLFESQIESLCPECSVRTANLPAATLGNTAPNLEVSDLQSHPDTDVAVLGADEMALGLPNALLAAGLEIEILGGGSSPVTLQYIKEGKMTVGLAADSNVFAWSMLDQIARQIIGQELTGLEAEGIGVGQFLTAEDITFDPAEGWPGYPDYKERFEKLWGIEG